MAIVVRCRYVTRTSTGMKKAGHVACDQWSPGRYIGRADKQIVVQSERISLPPGRAPPLLSIDQRSRAPEAVAYHPMFVTSTAGVAA